MRRSAGGGGRRQTGCVSLFSYAYQRLPWRWRRGTRPLGSRRPRRGDPWSAGSVLCCDTWGEVGGAWRACRARRDERTHDSRGEAPPACLDHSPPRRRHRCLASARRRSGTRTAVALDLDLDAGTRGGFGAPDLGPEGLTLRAASTNTSPPPLVDRSQPSKRAAAQLFRHPIPCRRRPSSGF
ncbi:hypothetical protein BDV95DRAFT_568514 [Massariosphaeria phaeospora]|uniref:Uncharacterized protein n=1 Tax=Massariosphaeria phaeospora TaxID=100035 RepID=A0A7C8I817_9PLEO|nr:hypothetical protein BDV95DRAFT_568514 [Massariosphaeria phaeospora]